MAIALIVLLLLILLFGSLGISVAKAFLFTLLIVVLDSVLAGAFRWRGR